MPPVQQEGEGKNREKKDHIAKRSFSGKTKKKKLIISKHIVLSSLPICICNLELSEEKRKNSYGEISAYLASVTGPDYWIICEKEYYPEGV